MQAPTFWNSENAISTMLLPFAWIYDFVRRQRIKNITAEILPVPVICIGNLSAGGAGKTPVALYIGKLLKEKNAGAYFLSRGYGGELYGPTLVDPDKHGSAEVGDEPLLLAEILPTVIAKDRPEGARFAIAQGAKIIVMDDGLQNPSIHKSISLAVVDGTVGFGNRRLLPAGPLREPLKEGIERVDAVIIINPVDEFTVSGAKKLLSASTQPIDAGYVKDKRWLAFAGIAYPKKFFATLHNLGGHVINCRAFSDHHQYSIQEIEALRAEAKELGAALITTAKDIVRVPKNMRENIKVLNIAITFENASALDELIFSAGKSK